MRDEFSYQPAISVSRSASRTKVFVQRHQRQCHAWIRRCARISSSTSKPSTSAPITMLLTGSSLDPRLCAWRHTDCSSGFSESPTNHGSLVQLVIEARSCSVSYPVHTGISSPHSHNRPRQATCSVADVEFRTPASHGASRASIKG